jgi:hypothetical protein
MRYPFEVMFSTTTGTFKAFCESWAEVVSSVNTHGGENLLFIQENH